MSMIIYQTDYMIVLMISAYMYLVWLVVPVLRIQYNLGISLPILVTNLSTIWLKMQNILSRESIRKCRQQKGLNVPTIRRTDSRRAQQLARPEHNYRLAKCRQLRFNDWSVDSVIKFMAVNTGTEFSSNSIGSYYESSANFTLLTANIK